MPLMSLGIASLCMSVAAPGQYNTACSKAVEAGTKQSGIYQLMDKTEQNQLTTATKTGQDLFGDEVVEVIAAGAYSYRVYNNKALRFKLPDMGIADSISNTITPNSYTLNFQWRLP